jgi:plasmid stabilization system protein ParE
MSAILFHPEADFEMMEAAVVYETMQHDLGKRFLSEVQNALNHILINPLLCPVIYRDVRRGLTRTFPFNVLYRRTGDQIIVMAVMHQKRHPDYWKSR